MRARLYCRTHKRWHSAHAAMHCRQGVKPGECTVPYSVDGVLELRPRGDRCPVWLPAWSGR